MSLYFKNFDFIIEEKRPSISEIKKIINKASEFYNIKDISYKYNHIINEDEEYYWFYSQYENIKTYNNKVFDNNTKKEDNNPRPKDKIEYRNQFFGLYDFASKILYLSNLDKKVAYQEYLNHTSQKEVIIKNLYKSFDEFINHIKEVKEIAFTERNNLFKVKNGIFDNPNNVYGLDNADSIKISACYNRAKIKDIGFSFINKIYSNKEVGKIEDLVIVGYDDKNFEQTFNTQNYIASCRVNVKQNENNLYNEQEVLENLLKVIRG